jgi:uncharacterized protein (TIGR00288 family)
MEDQPSKWKIIKKIFKRGGKPIALLIDGPNILRRIAGDQVRLEYIEDAARELGKIQVAKVFLNRHAPEKLLQAISNSGFSPVVALGDIHVAMAMETMIILHESNVKTLIIASRHARASILLRKAKEQGLETVAIGFDPGFSIALQNTADYVFKLKTPKGSKGSTT